jgi:dihydrolipoamide dehydrogenase
VKKYDLIVIGTGAGMNVAANATAQGHRVAIVDSGPLGGTCLNRGCIPSKVLLYPADVIRTLQEASRIGVHATLDRVDYDLIVERMWKTVLDGRHEMERGVALSDEIDFYNDVGSFVSDYTLQVGGKRIHSKRIVIASGARPTVPPIEGLNETGYLTSATLFDLTEPPKSLIIVGGGTIAVEFAHFFSAIGTQVTLVGRNPKLLPREEPEISALLQREMSRYMQIHTNHEALQARTIDGQKTITARDRETGQAHTFYGHEILLAAGRRSNADLLKPERTGVETDERGWIVVDPYLQTTKPGIWAMGDAINHHQYRHTANYHASLVWQNAFRGHQVALDEHAVPHAVFTHPQVASAGLTQAQAEQDYDILVGIKPYTDTAKGYAMGQEDAFFKVVVENGTGRILGAHAIGPHAAMLVQQLVYVMHADEGTYLPLARAQTIHPALSEVVVGALGNLQPVGAHGHEHHHRH